MTTALTPDQQEREREFQAFAASQVAPHAAAIDREAWIPESLVRSVAEQGYFGLTLPEKFGGAGAGPVTEGLLHSALAAASLSVQGLVNVHNMASQSIARWGTGEQKRRWLPELASGRKVAAFAITEENAGTDLAGVQTRAITRGDGFVLEGAKRFITCGQSADWFVLVARCDAGPTAFLVDRETEGFKSTPIPGLLGCRGYMLAELTLAGCELPGDALIGRPGVGVSHVASVGLDVGRYAIAWASAGVARAATDASIAHVTQREQFGSRLSDFQLIQKMIAEMLSASDASRLLCLQAADHRARRSPQALLQTAVAKYYASKAVNEVVRSAVQIHGARGCTGEYGIERWFRDARVLEVIEGSTQILETMIGQYACNQAQRERAA